MHCCTCPVDPRENEALEKQELSGCLVAPESLCQHRSGDGHGQGVDLLELQQLSGRVVTGPEPIPLALALSEGVDGTRPLIELQLGEH